MKLFVPGVYHSPHLSTTVFYMPCIYAVFFTWVSDCMPTSNNTVLFYFLKSPLWAPPSSLSQHLDFSYSSCYGRCNCLSHLLPCQAPFCQAGSTCTLHGSPNQQSQGRALCRVEKKSFTFNDSDDKVPSFGKLYYDLINPTIMKCLPVSHPISLNHHPFNFFY